ncbi:MAG: hypothetical protein LBD06_11375 [Candidatus Accumulibacter sp.]|nr:hypothetical protein [Accumulibacter sp.]
MIIARHGFMFRANEEKSRKTRARIRAVFAKRVKEPKLYTVTYAYFMKSGIFGQKSSSFVVGFSDERKELVAIPANFDMDEAGDAIRLNRDNILSAKFGLQGEVRIKSGILDKELRLVVPAYTPAALESASILPINQEAEAEAFRRFIEENF